MGWSFFQVFPPDLHPTLITGDLSGLATFFMGLSCVLCSDLFSFDISSGVFCTRIHADSAVPLFLAAVSPMTRDRLLFNSGSFPGVPLHRFVAFPVFFLLSCSDPNPNSNCNWLFSKRPFLCGCGNSMSHGTIELFPIMSNRPSRAFPMEDPGRLFSHCFFLLPRQTLGFFPTWSGAFTLRRDSRRKSFFD